MKTNFLHAFTLTLIFSLASLSNARTIEQTYSMLKLNQTNGLLYIDKIALEVGNSQFKIRTQKVSGQANNTGGLIQIQLIPDNQWNQQMGIYNRTCDKKAYAYPSAKPHSLIIKHELLLQNQISISQHTLQIPAQQLFYIILKDCSHHFLSDYTNPTLTFKLTLQIINNGSYLGQQQDHWLTFPVIIGIGLWMISTNKYFLKPEQQHDPDYAKMILFGAIGANISSLMWRSFGYILYAVKGYNCWLFYWIYLFMHSISQTLVLALLLLISMGWTLNYLTGTKIQLAIPIISFLAIMNIILAILTQSSQTNTMTHTYDAPTGSILIIIRLILGLAFLISTAVTICSSRYRIRQFLKKFSILGLGYICAMPIIVFIADRYISVKERSQFVFVGVEVMKTVCNIWLTYTVSSTKSQYNKLCYRNASFLPSQTGLF